MKHSNEKKAREAAALKYDARTDGAPCVVAIGKGYAAERMVEAAEESGVEVVKDKNLSSLLQQLSVGDEIPESLYEVVAEILVFISSMDSKYGARFGL